MNKSRVGILPARKYSDAARSWGGSAAKGGSPHEQLPWFPRGLQGADAGSAHSPSP
ncbi:MAG: hypothetical protein F6K26_00435 [Moorea sp. SIO2I5]|nr:hypothetical protein [Moorena sp. SIO2I5]